jgi:hypothetical protein
MCYGINAILGPDGRPLPPIPVALPVSGPVPPDTVPSVAAVPKFTPKPTSSYFDGLIRRTQVLGREPGTDDVLRRLRRR